MVRWNEGPCGFDGGLKLKTSSRRNSIGRNIGHITTAGWKMIKLWLLVDRVKLRSWVRLVLYIYIYIYTYVYIYVYICIYIISYLLDNFYQLCCNTTLTKACWIYHYNDVIMSAMSSQITGVSIIFSIVCSIVGLGADQRKHQSSASLAFVQGIHRWPVISPHKRPVRKVCHLMTSSWYVKFTSCLAFSNNRGASKVN